MKIALIAAVSADGYISTGQGVPWDLPEDRRHFRSCTHGQALLLGRRTYEEMQGWFQTGHLPLVLTRRPLPEGAPGQAVGSIEAAVEAVRKAGRETLWVCGGASVYQLAMPLATHLLLTEVESNLGSGVPFPEWDPTQWQEVSTVALRSESLRARIVERAKDERLKAEG